MVLFTQFIGKCVEGEVFCLGLVQVFVTFLTQLLLPHLIFALFLIFFSHFVSHVSDHQTNKSNIRCRELMLIQNAVFK